MRLEPVALQNGRSGISATQTALPDISVLREITARHRRSKLTGIPECCGPIAISCFSFHYIDWRPGYPRRHPPNLPTQGDRHPQGAAAELLAPVDSVAALLRC